ncbi:MULTISPECIES: phage tail tape measure protein [unclassified Pasteurella]|uniref:phage tail tape measure protein n=1 Tax=unclassified Pasteurella TaxID=2621516 RepID=UPI0010741C6E|nr:phage tail tape measure protein [Pasteurella sp. 19428wF3_WM03]TFU51221.1 phage tail tape measure protein [Pasteurella sp. WM03]
MNNLQLSVILNAIDKMTMPLKNANKQVSELSQKLKENKNIRNQLTKQERANEAAIKQYASTLNPLKNRLGELNQEVAKAQQKAKHYAQQLANAKNPTDEFKAKVLDAQNAVKKLKTEQGQAAINLRQARQALNSAGLSSQTLGQRQDELRQKLKNANQQIHQQAHALKTLNAKQAAYNQYRGKVENLKNISGKAQMVGAQSMAAGATILNPIKSTVQSYVEFEDAMLGVARQVPGLKDEFGNFTPEFEEWKQKIQDLSQELPLTTVEIANMVESAARMDIPKEELADFVRLNTEMATAFDAANPSELVDQFGKVSKNFKLTQAQTKELADTINYLDDNAISKGTGIIGYMNRVAGIAAVAKISSKNMAALGSTLQTLGAAEEDSATAVTTIFTRLGVAGNHKEVDTGLAKLGLNPKKIAQGMAKDAQATLMLIVEKIKNLKDNEKTDVIKNLVGIPHIKTISKLVENTEEWKRQIELANSELAKDSMHREFETRMKGLSSQWQLFKNSLFNLSTTIGGTLAPTLTELMTKIGGVINKFQSWIKENPKLAKNILLITAAIGSSLTVFGALSMALSFVLYPVARLGLGLFNLKKIFPETSSRMGSMIKILMSWKKTFNMLGAGIIQFLTKLKSLSTWLNMFKGIFRLAFSPIRMILVSLGSAISFLFSPISLLVAALIAAGVIIYRNWEKVRAFFGGFWEGLKSGLAPVIEKFKPLGDLFGVVVGWIEKAVKWFMDLLSPVQSTQTELDSARSAGEKFGNGMAKAIELILTPLTLLMDGIKWLTENMPSWDSIKNSVSNAWDSTKNAAGSAWQSTKETAGNIWGKVKEATGFGSDGNQPPVQKWSGGYVGNGGKYQPMGIVHGGEYVMTKEATSRLGIHTLNALNYGKQALIAGGLGVSVATAAPVQVDHRPPISVRPVTAQVAQPMNVNITINAAKGMDERMIAQQVAKEFQRIQTQQQARTRNSLRDRV